MPKNTGHPTCHKLMKWGKHLLILIVILIIVALAGNKYQYWDNDPERGAAVVANDVFGDHFDKTVYLNQNWKPEESLWFYTTTQGSDLMPYDFFLALEQENNEKLFRNNENINRYRYLPQNPSFSNPDGLPVGMVKDSYKGKDYMGYTCAACHTNQINYKGTGIRIDGGPSAADMESFIRDIAKAMYAPLKGTEKNALPKDKAKLERFIKAVQARGTYSDETKIIADLKKFAQRVKTYTIINNPGNSRRENGVALHPKTTYGYARLDAFGRIFNRVLEHIMSAAQIRNLLANQLTPAELNEVMKGAEPILSGNNRDHIIERLQKYMTPKEQIALRNTIYNPPDAPVSYPFLWDIPQHDYVQWNGIVANAGVGPVGRNAGQVIGVFGTLDWKEQDHRSLSTILGGQNFSGPWVNFESSVNVRNLQRVEHALSTLQSPLWPEQILGKIDQKSAKRGAPIFDKYCASCHAEIDRSSPTRRVVAQMTSTSLVGTDPKMAENSVTFSGYSGILRNIYLDTGVGKLLMEKKAPVAALLTSATRNVITTPDPDKWPITSWLERIYDFAVTFFDNKVQSSLKRGNYVPDTTINPFASLVAYKGRSLNGIWATAPYLHNGSVPTLYDLLLPAKDRPKEFQVGSREFDPVKVGFKSDGYKGFRYRTSVPGNHNSGHEYAAGNTPQANGKVLPALNENQRHDLLEYLKTL